MLEIFLDDLLKDLPLLAIIRDEIEEELPEKLMTYIGPSGMVALRTVFGIPDHLISFPHGLTHVFQSALEQLKGKPRAEVMQRVESLLRKLYTLWITIWNGLETQKVSTFCHFIRNELKVTLRESALLAIYEEDPVLRRILSDGLLVSAGCVVPAELVELEEKAGQLLVTRALTSPITLSKADIAMGCWELLNIIDDPVMGQVKPGNTLSMKTRAQLILLQLVCGSRSLGVYLMNRFTKVDADYVQVHNITKQLDEVTRRARRAKKRWRGGHVTHIPPEELITSITRPINHYLLDRRILSSMINGTLYVDNVSNGTGAFMRMIREVRYTMRTHALYDGIKMSNEGGFTTEQLFVSESPTPAILYAVMNRWRKNVTSLAKNAFGGDVIKGTHSLRKMYLALAFDKYGKHKMKEPAFASRVFGHKGYSTSLYYTNIILTD
jgi:hypothetical protein